MYLLPITEADLVLDAKWLAMRGPHIADYEAMAFTFYLQGKFSTLYGARSKHPTIAEFHNMKWLVQIDAIAEVFTLQL